MDRDKKPNFLDPISSDDMKPEGWREEDGSIDERDAPGHVLPETERDED